MTSSFFPRMSGPGPDSTSPSRRAAARRGQTAERAPSRGSPGRERSQMGQGERSGRAARQAAPAAEPARRAGRVSICRPVSTDGRRARSRGTALRNLRVRRRAHVTRPVTAVRRRFVTAERPATKVAPKEIRCAAKATSARLRGVTAPWFRSLALRVAAPSANGVSVRIGRLPTAIARAASGCAGPRPPHRSASEAVVLRVSSRHCHRTIHCSRQENST